jgi:hypothetical protein
MVPAKLKNYFTQIRYPELKIFFIGFNKCATTSLHYLMKSAGIRSLHWVDKRKENLALQVDCALRDGTFKNFASKFTAISDMFYFDAARIVEANEFFREFHEAFPQSYFILNDRDVDKWIASRCRHRKGELLQRFKSYYNTNESEIISIWRSKHAGHIAAATEYFAGNPRFLHFRIDSDPITNLTDLLAPHFEVNPCNWKIRNKSSIQRKADP